MKYVLDANIAVKWVLAETDSASAIRRRVDYRNRLIEFIAPDIYPVEVAHALTRAERRGFIGAGQAVTLLGNVVSTSIPMHPYQPLLQRAVAISSSMRCGVYDCLYVALAEREGCELLTADDKLVKNLRPSFPFVIALSSLP